MKPLTSLALILPLAGCFVTSPTGIEQSWPPALGLEVAAIASTDLNGDGKTDLVIAGAGEASDGGGLYFIDGATDFADTKDNVIAKFTRFVPHDVRGAAAFQQTAEGLLFANTPGVVSLELLDDNLATIADDTDVIALQGGATVWFGQAAFPGDMTRLVIGTELSVRHFKPAAGAITDAHELPGPMRMWESARLATGYKIGTDPIAVVAENAAAYRTVVGTSGSFAYEAKPHPDWRAQVSADVDGSTIPEVLGLDMDGKLCALDLEDGTLSCRDTFTPSGTPSLIVAPFAMNANADALVMYSSDTQTRFRAYVDLARDGEMLTGTEMMEGMFGFGGAKAVTLSAPPPGPMPIIVVGRDGSSGCLAMSCK